MDVSKSFGVFSDVIDCNLTEPASHDQQHYTAVDITNAFNDLVRHKTAGTSGKFDLAYDRVNVFLSLSLTQCSWSGS